MKAGAGYSTVEDSQLAGRKAAEEAVRSSGEPALTLLFTTDSYNQEAVLAAVKGVVGKAKIAGFCGGAVITPGGLFQQGVVVGTLSGDELRVATALEGGADEDPRGAGRRCGEALLASGIDRGIVIALPDAFQANVYEVARGLYEAMGPDFKYTGGGAGDSLKFVRTYQFTEEGVNSQAIAAALVDGPAVGTGIGHGWKVDGPPLIITRAEGKIVYEIGARPAFDVYSERLGGIVAERFPEYGMIHPLGFPDLSGNYLIRDPLSVNDDKSINIVSEVPRSAVARMMKGDPGDLIETAGAVAKKATLEVARPQMMLVFDCISRYVLMGQEFERELAAIREPVGREVPMLGALSFGEIGSYAAVPLFHNKTVAVAVLGGEG